MSILGDVVQKYNQEIAKLNADWADLKQRRLILKLKLRGVETGVLLRLHDVEMDEVNFVSRRPGVALAVGIAVVLAAFWLGTAVG